ncbi:hypothetical protein [Longibacter sp.]|uniref:hypothetical protein n=1 Tax=Longibacter sp. TaxID=2045415 RepID=UPI003EC09DB0
MLVSSAVGVLILGFTVGPAGAVRHGHERPVPRAVADRDTLRQTVQAGKSLILTLPERINDRPVSRYYLIRGPALSSVAGRSLLWVTRPEDTGLHRIDLIAEADGSPIDTVRVKVSVK